ncbi:MAG: substrate-binding domain-containing protein [Edaphocola sp.]
MRIAEYVRLGLCGTFLSLAAASCGGDAGPAATNNGSKPETTTSGSINISVDESYRAVIEQELAVFDSSYPDAHIKAKYTTGNESFNDLSEDSARLIITDRDLTPEEKKAYKAHEIKVKSLAIASDAIAVIVNPASPDSLMTLGQLRNILAGKFARKYNIVFNNTGSSIVSYISDTLLGGQPLTTKPFAVANTDSLIAYIARTGNAIGFIGVNRAYDPESTEPAGAFLKQIKVVALNNENDTANTGFYKPYQAYIGLKQYPLRRNMYFITRDSWNGLGAGFANFLTGQAGQLIINKARLFPLQAAVTLREAEIKP